MPKTLLSSAQLNTLINHRNTLTLILSDTYIIADAARQADAPDLEQHLYQTANLASRARHGLEKAILWGAADPSFGATADVVDGHEMPQSPAGVVR